MSKELLDRIANAAIDRRKFVMRAGATGLGVAAMTMLGSGIGKAQTETTPTTYSDVDILNFALNLEYLEAEFYSMATYGSTLVELGVITQSETSGPTTGGNMVSGFKNSPVAFLATALRNDEIAHVKLLRTALGSSAVPKPAINLAALGYGFSSVSSFLELGRQFEDVGLSAYLGAAPSIQSKTYLATAAAILGTEAQHSGSLRLECIQWGTKSPAVDSLDIPPTSSAPYDVDKNALSIPRTPQQVLSIVYGGGTSSGAFFPDGMNGTITTT